MSIERYQGKSQLICDDCGDSQDRTYASDEFDVMVSDAKRDGWKIQKIDGEWAHFCPSCS